MKSLSVFFFIIFIFFQPISAHAEKQWKQILKNYALQLEVYSRETSSASAKELKAIAILPYSTQDVYDVLIDHEAWVSFIPYLDTSKVISQNEQYSIVYKHFDFPIIDDRDTIEVIVSKKITQRRSFEIEWNSSDNSSLVPEKEDTVRLSKNSGKWIIEPYEQTHTKVTFFALADLGGNLPKWIVNLAKGLAVPKVLKAIRKQLEEKVKVSSTKKT